MKKVALLGTKFTMQMDFYKDKLAKAGIEMIVPDGENFDFVHQSIINELLKDIFTNETRKKFTKLIDELKAEGAQGIILGCTEIPMLMQGVEVGVPMFDTLNIHVNAAIEFALNNK